MNDYIIVSDGTIDLDRKTVEKLGIRVIPMIYILNGTEHFFDPSAEDFDFSGFYEQVNAGVPVSTSQNPPRIFTDFFLELLKGYKKILYICFSSGLSGNYGSAYIAAEEVMQDNPGCEIKVINSLCASVGEGYLVRAVCEKRDEGASFEEITEYAEKIKRDVCHWFVVGNLEQLKRGGRINAVEAKLGSILNIHPILTTDSEGKLMVSEKVRGMKKAIHELVDKFLKYSDESIMHRVIVAHAGAPELAEQLISLLKETGRISEFLTEEIGPVIGAHTGAPMCAVVFTGTQEE
ncbi:MAG: DegV family protein [Lachnospiraceae bacterium]|nr:DegV family protein [Lachnospiraceae bacterium]